jgi:hypothetical protein
MWYYYPPITGHARIRSGQSSSTVLALSAYPQTESSILNAGTAGAQYEGIALVNTSTSAATVTLQALNASGSLLGTATVNIGAGQTSAKLLSEYFSVSIPEGSVIRVTSTAPIMTTSVTGTTSGDVLRSSPGQR